VTFILVVDDKVEKSLGLAQELASRLPAACQPCKSCFVIG